MIYPTEVHAKLPNCKIIPQIDIYFKDNILGTAKTAPRVNSHPDCF